MLPRRLALFIHALNSQQFTRVSKKEANTTFYPTTNMVLICRSKYEENLAEFKDYDSAYCEGSDKGLADLSLLRYCYPTYGN